MNYTNRWISIFTDLFALVIITACAYFGVLSKNYNLGVASPALVGLALTWAF